MANSINGPARLTVVFAAGLMIAVALNACNLGVDEKTRNVLESAIRALHDQPGQWEHMRCPPQY